MPGTDTPSQYIQLAFMIERHFPGYVDAYFGPPELKAQGMDGARPEIATLEDFVASFGQALTTDPDLAPDRRAYLQAECQAMRTTIQILAGHAPGLLEEVRSLYGVTPTWVAESSFEAAHQALSKLLPGSEPLPQKVQAFRERSRVPAETAVAIAGQLMEDFRNRTQRLFGLPPDERCEITTVEDQPWMAYNWYLGDGKSRIELNLDHPKEAWDLPNTVAHEAYPGHHSEFAIKENRLYRGEGRLEHAIHLNNNPSALISEGIAKNALPAIASEGEIADILQECYTRAGLSGDDARLALDFAKANRQLESVTDNQVLMLFRDHVPEDEVIRYGMRYSLTIQEDEARFLRFIADPLSRSYTYNYTLGAKLVEGYLEKAADQRQAFLHLLSAPVTPEQLSSSHL